MEFEYILDNYANLLNYLKNECKFKVEPDYRDNQFPKAEFFEIGDRRLLGVLECYDEIEMRNAKQHFLIDKAISHCGFFLGGKVIFYRNYGERKFFTYSKLTKQNISKSDKLKKAGSDIDILFQAKDISGDFYESFKVKRDIVAQSIRAKIDTIQKYLLAQKLFDRIFFIYFLCHKRIIRHKNSEAISGSTVFRALIYQGNFVKNLYSLFKALNKPDERFLSVGPLKLLVPYLNGSLFRLELHENEVTFNLRSSEWEDIFGFLNSYHWIIEDDVEEVEEDERVLTPEILGHVYERSVIEWEKKGFEQEVEEALGRSERRALGVYYTPELITEYISNNCLYPYISEKIERPYVSKEEIVSEEDPGKLQLIIDLLNEIRILDPACGSGAFLIKIADTIFKLKSAIITKLGSKPDHYKIKLDIILNNIFGIDILAGAIEIAKLRLWLWLVSTYSQDSDIQPLPNIDYNICKGNTLVGWIDEPIQPNLSNPLNEELHAEFNNLLNIVPEKDKNHLKKILKLLGGFSDDNTHQISLVNYAEAYTLLNALYKGSHGTSSMYLKVIMEKLRHRIYDSVNPSLLSYLNDKLDPKWRKRKKVSPPIRENEFISFKPFHWKIDLYSQREGFDIIIGNPPYVDSERMVKTAPKFRDVLSGVYASANGNWDLYIPFFERAMQITNDNGIVCFISPNKWLSIGYGKSMRQMLKPHVSGLCNCDEIRVFSDAANSPVISFFNKRKLSESINIHYFDSSSSILKRNPTPRTILDIDNWGVLISEYLDTLLQIMNQKYQLDPDFCDVENPFTVSEAYDLVKVLYDGKPQENELKLVNTGTIDRFESLWGREKTTYIQMDYIYPYIQKNKLRKLMPYRYEQSCSPKIIITGIRYFESFLDKDGEYVAGKSTIIIRNGRMVPLEGINALLNSTLIGFYMREAFKATGIGGGTNFSSSMVESIPVPKLRSDEISTLVQFNRDISSYIENSDSKKLTDALNKLDNFVYQLYNLSKNNIEIIKNYKARYLT